MKTSSANSELTFQLIVESSPSAMILVNQAGKIAYINNKTERLFGYTKNELIGKTIEVLIPPRFTESHLHLRNRFLVSPEPKVFGSERDLFGMKKDGTEFSTEISLNPLVTIDGTWVVASINDISERKRFEEERTLFASIVNSTNDSILSKNLNGFITSWNKGAEKVFGYSAAEAIGNHISILIPPHLQNEETEIIGRIVKGESVENYETERIRKDGKLIQVSLTVSPITDFQGNIIGASKISRDITESKEAARKLDASRELYRHTLDNMLEGIQIHDFNWRYTYANNAYLKYRNYSMEELVGQTLLEKYPGIESTQLFPILKRCMEERIPEHLETEFVFPSGKVGYFELSIQPVPEGIFILSIDITQRRKDQEKINKATRLYAFLSQINQSIVHIKERQALFDKACEIAVDFGKFKFAWVGLVDEDAGKVNLVSHNGIAADEFAIYDNLYYKQPSFYLSPLERAITTGKYSVSNHVQNDLGMENFKDQAEKRNYTSVIILPLKQSGKTIGVFSCISTVTNFFDTEEINLLVEAAGDISFALDIFEKEEHRQMYERKLAESELSLKEAQEVANIGNWELTYATGIAVWSEEQCKIFGLPLDQQIQSPETFLSFVHPDDVEFVKDKVEQSRFRLDDHSFYCKIIRKDGEIRHIYTKSRFRLDKQGKPVSIYGITHDVTERKLAEEELLVNNAELKKTNSELDRFVYSVSHELRMPLTSIMGLQALIKKEYLSERDKGLIDLIKKCVFNIDELLREILDYSRNTRVEITTTSIDLSTLIDGAFESLNLYQDGFSIAKKVTIKETAPFYSDSTRIKILINNLVSNAFKYSKKNIADAFIEIKVEVDKERMALEISDNGIGIKKELLPNIFKMFYRATAAVSGSGLGLYIVKESVEKLGGSIVVESELEKGTKFMIELPNSNPADIC